MKKGTNRRKYPPEFKLDAIRLAEKIGVGEAEYTTRQLTKMEVSKEHSHRKISGCCKTSKGS